MKIQKASEGRLGRVFHVGLVMRVSLSVLIPVWIILALLSLSVATNAISGQADCQGGFTYLVETENGGYYALVGLPSGLRSQYVNHTARISLAGTFYPSNPMQYLHSDPNYRGLIYITQYSINGVTFTFARTAVMISGTVTTTSTITNQISPTTMTLATTTATLTPISVTGLLDYSQEYCVATLATSSSSSSTNETGNSNLRIPGFTAEAVIMGLVIGTLFLVAARKRRASAVDLEA